MSLKEAPTSEPIQVGGVDIEQQAHDASYLDNHVVKTLTWRDVTVIVPDRDTKQQKQILSAVNGHVAAGKTNFHFHSRWMYMYYRA